MNPRDEIEAARTRGVDVAADMYPYTAGGTGLEATIPSWVFEGVMDSVRARIARFEGKTLTAIAEEWGKDPADAAWDLVAAGDGRVMAIYHMMSEEDVRRALQRPWTSIGSDAGAALQAGTADVLGLPHPRSYGTFPRILGRYVRDAGTLRLEEAIRKMTSWPATKEYVLVNGVVVIEDGGMHTGARPGHVLYGAGEEIHR